MEPRTPPRGSRSSRGFPATPATPRFGSFEDLPSHPRGPAGGDGSGKIAKEGSARAPAAHTPLRRKRSRAVLATPRQTPRKRRESPEDGDPGPRTDLLAKLRAPDAAPQPAQQPAQQPAPHPKSHSKLQLHSQPKLEPEVQPEVQPQVQQKPAHHTVPLAQHPHADAPPPDVPGMWYVFRGKKIFRPFPPGEEPLKPVTLFKDILDARKGARQPARIDRTDLFKDALREEALEDALAAGREVDSDSDSDAAGASEADTDIEWDRV